MNTDNGRSIKITLDKAVELYNSSDSALREIALLAYSKEEILAPSYNIDRYKHYANVFADYTESGNATTNTILLRKGDTLGYSTCFGLRLLDLANLLNPLGWRPKPDESKYAIMYSELRGCPIVQKITSFYYGIPYFKTNELAHKALELLEGHKYKD